jgi:hypothetical protein
MITRRWTAAIESDTQNLIMVDAPQQSKPNNQKNPLALLPRHHNHPLVATANLSS